MGHTNQLLLIFLNARSREADPRAKAGVAGGQRMQRIEKPSDRSRHAPRIGAGLPSGEWPNCQCANRGLVSTPVAALGRPEESELRPRLVTRVANWLRSRDDRIGRHLPQIGLDRPLRARRLAARYRLLRRRSCGWS